jgi:signal transduction histidine kinase/CheY-like chemotaxis protein
MHQVRGLSAKQASQGYPVHLSGVVTFHDERHRLLTVQDSTAGVSIDARALSAGQIAYGADVEIDGWTGADAAAPIIVKPHVRIRGLGKMPAARRASLKEVASGRFDFEWVEVKGIVTSVASLDNAHIRIGLTQEGHNLEIYLSSEAYVNRGVLGREVTARGVPTTFHDTAGNSRKARLHVPQYREVLASGFDLNAKPTASKDSAPPTQLLTTALAVKQLTPEQAARQYPVKLRAIVNNYMPSFGGLFVQDATAGIYVSLLDGPDLHLPIGSEVEVTGLSSPGDFAPAVSDAKARVLGPGSPFAPLPIQNPDTIAMSDENRWGRVAGTVRRVTSVSDLGVDVDISVGGRPFTIKLVGDENAANFGEWVDADVAAEGVLSPIYDRFRRLLGFTLISPARRFVQVTKAAPVDPFGGPSLPLASLQQFRQGSSTAHRVKVSGTVTSVWGDSNVTISDGRNGLELQAAESFQLRVGDEVEAIGFPSAGGAHLGLASVVARKTGQGRAEAPRDLDVEDVLVGADEARLVRLEGLLVNQESQLGDVVLMMTAGTSGFTASIEQPQPSPRLVSLRKGSTLRVTGVCLMDWDRSRYPPEPRGIRLRLRSPDDIEVLQQASWWTVERMVSILAGVAAVLILALAWVGLLRNQVRRQTAQIAAQAEQSRLLEGQLARAQRLESVGRLAGGIAHDFNNMLTVINGYSNLLQSEAGLSASVRSGLSEIAKAGHRAAALTHQMLAFGRRQMLQPVVLDLNEVICEMEGMLRRLVGERTEFALKIEPHLGLVKADPGQIQQVLLNLVVNARDAMPEGGRLLITTANCEIAIPFVENDEEVRPGSYVSVSVTDSGSGMDSETLKKIFEPFFTTKPVGQGTGLGLSMVFGIVKQSGGHVRVESEPGKGSCFEIRLPRVSSETGPVEAPADRTVLVVEPHPEVRQLVKEVLNSAGYRVLHADRGEQAIELVRELQAPIHLLLTGVELAGMAGADLARRLRGQMPHLRVVFMSGLPEDESASDPADAGASAFLLIPFAPRTLLARVRAALS